MCDVATIVRIKFKIMSVDTNCKTWQKTTKKNVANKHYFAASILLAALSLDIFYQCIIVICCNKHIGGSIL